MNRLDPNKNMKFDTLEITKISFARGFADVTICEVSTSGFRDGFEHLRLTFDSLAPKGEAIDDVDAQLQRIAAERGLNY